MKPFLKHFVHGSPVPKATTNTKQSTEITEQGQFGNRQVRTDSGSVGPMQESVGNVTVAKQINERSVGMVPDDPARLPISWFARHLLPPDTKLDGEHQDGFSLLSLDVADVAQFHKTIRDVLYFAENIDKDISCVTELLEKSERKHLNKKECRKVNTLLGAGKYNLIQMQNWTLAVTSPIHEIAKSASYAKQVATTLDKLQARLVNRLITVSDISCRYDIDHTSSAQASSAGPSNHSVTLLDSALDVARELTVRGLSADAKQELIAVLESKRSALVGNGDLASGSDKLGPNLEFDLTLMSHYVWESNFSLDPFITKIKSQWRDSKLTEEQTVQKIVSDQLKKAGVAKKHMPDLNLKFKEALNRVREAPPSPLMPIEKQVRYTSTVDGEDHTVHSKITPVKVMVGADHLATDFSANGGGDRMQYTHVPNLAHTELTDEGGKTLFTALRHGVMNPLDITASVLSKLPDQELFTMVKDLLVVPQFKPVSAGIDQEQITKLSVDMCVEKIRSSPTSDEAKAYAFGIRDTACMHMAQELVGAALVSDPDKLQAALDGNVVDLNLSSISLLTPDRVRKKPEAMSYMSYENSVLQRQTEALRRMDSRNNPSQFTVIQIRDTSGDIRTVKLNCKVRAFNFGISIGAVGGAKHSPSQMLDWDKLMGWSYTMEHNSPELRTLLGNSQVETLGGDVADKLTELESKQQRLGTRLKGMERSLQTMAAKVGVSERLLPNISKCKMDIEATTQSITTLREVATATKHIWREGGSHNRGDQNPYNLVSRLGLVINEMGENLAFNCKSGLNRAGELDAELKYFATLNAAGSLPAPGALETPQSQQMRSDFRFNSGNLEMQGMNIEGVHGSANAITSPELHSKPSELKLSNQITYLNKVNNTCPEQCAVFAANHFKLECIFDTYKETHQDQIDIVGPLGLLAPPDTKESSPRDFFHGYSEDLSLQYLLKLDKHAIYCMRTGRNDGVGHNQMLHVKDNEWFVYSSETNQRQLTSEGSLTDAGRDLIMKPHAKWGKKHGQAAIFTVQVTEESTRALIDFIKDCRNEGKDTEEGEQIAYKNLSALL